MDPQTVRYGATITEPEPPTRDGYIFDGWFKDEALTAEWNFATDTVTEAITLYARWEPTPATAVGLMIGALPEVSALTLDNLDDVEAAEAAYEGLSSEEKQQVDPALVAKLNSAVNKITQLVLEDVDARFNYAKENLNLAGSGINRVEYENRKATFYIDNPDSQVLGFLQTGVVELFQALCQDVVSMKLNNKHSYPIESGATGPYFAGARIVLVMLGHEEYITNPMDYLSELMAAPMSQLQGQSVAIELTIKPGIKEYIGSYVVEFKGIDCTVTVDAEGGVTGDGTYEIGSVVEITVTLLKAWRLKLSKSTARTSWGIVDGKYTFIIKSDVTVEVDYKWKYYR